MRQIIIDTETTGLEPSQGHRIIEIGCIEILNRKRTGNSFHSYINPQRKIEADSTAITGITDELLIGKPIFSEILPDFLNFIKGAELIAHNAKFDINFINHELKLINKTNKLLSDYVSSIFDTLALARKMFPGQRNTLDALCKRYKIDLSGRKLHGALLDAQLLAEVYLLMTGGQISLFDQDEFVATLSSINNTNNNIKTNNTKKIATNRPALPIIYANEEELKNHENFIRTILKI